MDVTMRYGKSGLPVHLPAEWEVTVMRKRDMPVLPAPAAAVRAALEAPVDARPLRESARGCGRACILICDATRPVPNGLLLPALLDSLGAAGVPADRTTLLVATGLHRPCTEAERREVVGDAAVLHRVRVVDHVARNDADHVLVGTTRQGTPVRLDRRFVEADVRVAVGLVEPHFMAGYSGGRKLIAPGIAHHQTITRIHSAGFLEDPRAADGVLDGKPLHAELLEIAALAGGALALNVVLNEQRQVSFVNCGALAASHRAAVAFLRGFAEVPVARRFAVVLTSAAGDPLDRTYYQTVKGMVSALGALAPGGDLFIVSGCSELGSPEFRTAQARLQEQGGERFIRGLLAKPQAEVDEWETEMLLRATRAGRVHLYAPGLKAEDRALTCVEIVADLERELGACLATARTPRLAVIPEGPYVIPVCAEPAASAGSAIGTQPLSARQGTR